MRPGLFSMEEGQRGRGIVRAWLPGRKDDMAGRDLEVRRKRNRMGDLGSKIADNTVFVLEFALLVFAVFFIARAAERRLNRRNGYTGRILTTGKISMIGLFAAISTVLMLFEMPVPFAPPFYKIDLSELPVLIIAFAYGPVAGVMTEFIKILLKLVVKSTSTAFVGELANFLVGCSLVLPASVIYLENKTKKQAMLALGAGVLIMTVFGSAFNGIYLLPKFAQLFGMPLEAIVGMGTKINAAVTSVGTLVMFCVAPLNLLKGGIDTILTLILYKRLSPILKNSFGAASGRVRA